MVNAMGQQIWVHDEDVFSYKWFDNERLWFLVSGTKRGDKYFTVIMNPFTGERQELYPDYPNNYLDYGFDSIRWRWTSGIPLYDPTATRVIYPECPSTGCVNQSVKAIVLWNIPKHQVLARIEPADFYIPSPIWSPDGQQFIIVNDTDSGKSHSKEEFFSVSREGQVRKLTRLSDYLNIIEIRDSYVFRQMGSTLLFGW
jgi:hypothetical protein